MTLKLTWYPGCPRCWECDKPSGPTHDGLCDQCRHAKWERDHPESAAFERKFRQEEEDCP